MKLHIQLSSRTLWEAIQSRHIRLAGNRQLKIYGRLDCVSGKRLKKQNRVFFVSEEEAIGKGYRPCGRCMPLEYKKWKNGII